MDIQTYKHTEIEATLGATHRTKKNKAKVLKISYMDTTKTPFFVQKSSISWDYFFREGKRLLFLFKTYLQGNKIKPVNYQTDVDKIKCNKVNASLLHYLNLHMYLFSQKCLQHLFKRFLQGNQSVNYVISNPITIILDIKLYYTQQCSCFRMPYHYYIIYFDGQRPHICNNKMIVQAPH